jgi:3-hydroxyisobutyrate dehydrogenase-like beta-hydroxyacid dehydrogenase
MLSPGPDHTEAPVDAVAGFIGLGTMGSAMSAHLLAAGFEVTGYDIDPARLAAHAGRGGAAAAGPAGAAARADVVVTSLPTAAALTEVVTGAAGLATAARPGLVVIETSTLPVAVKHQARGALAAGGAVLLDCPLSGTGGQARAKDLVAYLSGPAEAKARALPVLRAFTRAVHDVGEFGNGSAVKFIANLLVAIHNVAAAEALVLAERAGLNLGTVLAAVADGAGSSDMFEVRGPAMAAADYSGPGVTTTVFAKDLEIIAGFAAQTGTPTPLFALASTFYAAALAQGHAADDTACVHAVLRGLAGG